MEIIIRTDSRISLQGVGFASRSFLEREAKVPSVVGSHTRSRTRPPGATDSEFRYRYHNRVK